MKYTEYEKQEMIEAGREKLESGLRFQPFKTIVTVEVYDNEDHYLYADVSGCIFSMSNFQDQGIEIEFACDQAEWGQTVPKMRV